ncbi:MAG: 50S ribosomal protein L28 [bacterium JZ-2024 1]
MCDICGKKSTSGHRISHSGKRSKRQFLPNLREKRIWRNGRWQTLRLCTRCLKRLTASPA